MLKINNISKSYNHHKVLDNINLDISKNSIIGLAGSSGSGKSTLLRCIQGLEKFDSGQIACDEKAGFMFQDFQLFPHMTVINNLTYAPSLNNIKYLNNNSITDNALELLDKLGIKNRANFYPSQLSGGQKQRVALARSLMMQPSLLLCDEPTSGLDVATILEVINLLKYVRDLGITMIIASHDLDFLTKIADKIILLKNGNITKIMEPDKVVDPIKELQDHY